MYRSTLFVLHCFIQLWVLVIIYLAFGWPVRMYVALYRATQYCSSGIFRKRHIFWILPIGFSVGPKYLEFANTYGNNDNI